MASPFLTGFGTGFFTDTANNIQKRRDDADEYFRENLQLARRTALRNHQISGQNTQEWTGVARKLEGAGVPRDIVLAIANGNPEDLSEAYNNITDLQSRGVEVDEEFIRSYFDVKGEIDPNMSYSEFFSKVTSPVAEGFSRDRESFKNDPKGSIWASMMGFNAMEKADRRLEDTMINGRSASDWIADDGTLGQPFGDASVSVNHTLGGEAARAAKGGGAPSISDIRYFTSEFDKAAEAETIRLIREENLTPDEAAEKARQTVGSEFRQIAESNPEHGAAIRSMLPSTLKYIYPEAVGGEEEVPALGPAVDDPITETVLPIDDMVGAQVPPDPEAPQSQPETNFDYPEKDEFENRYEFISDYGDKTSLWIDKQTGRTYRLNNVELNKRYGG